MSQPLPATPHTIPVSDFSRGRAGRAFDAAQQQPVFVYSRSKPIAVILNVGEYERLRRLDALLRAARKQ